VRKIFYVPKEENIDEYKSQWENVYAEIQHGISENTKDLIKDVDKAGEVSIPEYRFLEVPINFSDKDYVQFNYWDDFEVIKKDKPEIISEIYTNDLDNPSSQSVLLKTLPMHYVEIGNHWQSDFLKLDIGWYEVVIKVDGIEVETKETSVYEYYFEEE
jgi:hypothetical protein